MAQTSAERQRIFKERRFAEGYKKIELWVHRSKRKKPDIADFVRYVDMLTGTWSESKKSKFFAEVVEIIKAKQEVKKKK